MRFRTALACLPAVFVAVHLSAGCGSQTGSKRFAFEARVGGAVREAAGPFTFTNEVGWTVTLSKADVTLGPVYLNVVPSLQDTTAQVLGFFVRRAHAAGDSHLSEGRVVGEVLSQVKFDALSSTLAAMSSPGLLVEERVRTAEVWFYPELGVSPDTNNISTVALEVLGEATRAEQRVRFRGSLVLNDAWLSDGSSGSRGKASIADIRKVRGIRAEFLPEEGGHLEIRMDVRRLFRGADFSNLEGNPIDRDGNRVLVQSKTGKVTTDQVMTNLYQGLREANGTYSVQWVKGE